MPSYDMKYLPRHNEGGKSKGKGSKSKRPRPDTPFSDDESWRNPAPEPQHSDESWKNPAPGPQHSDDSWRTAAPAPQIMRAIPGAWGRGQQAESWKPSLNLSPPVYTMRPIPHKGGKKGQDAPVPDNVHTSEEGKKGGKKGKKGGGKYGSSSLFPSRKDNTIANDSTNASQLSCSGDGSITLSTDDPGGNRKCAPSLLMHSRYKFGAGAPPPPPPPPPPPDVANNQFVSRTTDTTRRFLTTEKFASLNINQQMKRSLREVLQYEFMTDVQKATLPVLLKENDVFARAKTGTGKTLAFLIPTVEKIISKRSTTRTTGIGSIVISPTRELAMQIYEECRALTRFIADFKLAIVYGGTNIKSDHKQFNGRVDLLVATPGRLLDHLQNTNQFAQKCSGLQSLILDEADQLLETGFLDAITSIIKFFPTERQSLLFSATVPKEVLKVAKFALKPNYEFVDCVGDVDEHTVKQAKQSLITCELDDSLSTLISLVQKAKKDNPANAKVVVFFITARQTQFSAAACNNLGLDVTEIHSRKSQAARTQASDKFRNATTGVLFSSDVSARGMDYPNVTHVIQVGAPSSREQYIHRLGRTARAGTEGCGVLLLHTWEEYFLKNIADLPLERMGKAEVESLKQYAMDEATIRNAVQRVDSDTKIKCYCAWLGFYNGLCPKRIYWSKPELVEWANYYALNCLYLREVPLMEKKTIGKMGLKGVPGLRC